MQEKHVIDPKLLSQNGNYISYKTNWYGDSLSFFNELGKSLTDFLEKSNIPFMDDSITICKAQGTRRNGTITVRVTSNYTGLSFDSNSID